LASGEIANQPERKLERNVVLNEQEIAALDELKRLLPLKNIEASTDNNVIKNINALNIAFIDDRMVVKDIYDFLDAYRLRCKGPEWTPELLHKFLDAKEILG
jgi:hypothetical protein